MQWVVTALVALSVLTVSSQQQQQPDVSSFTLPGPCPEYQTYYPFYWNQFKGLWFDQRTMANPLQSGGEKCRTTNFVGNGNPNFDVVMTQGGDDGYMTRFVGNGTRGVGSQASDLDVTFPDYGPPFDSAKIKVLYTDYHRVTITYQCEEVKDAEGDKTTHLMIFTLRTRSQNPGEDLILSMLDSMYWDFGVDLGRFVKNDHDDCRF